VDLVREAAKARSSTSRKVREKWGTLTLGGRQKWATRQEPRETRHPATLAFRLVEIWKAMSLLRNRSI